MATGKGQVTLRGRFRPGTDVRLVQVRDERVLRAEGGVEVGTATVDDGGAVQFSSGVDVGGRYLVCGYVDGFPLEVRARGREAGDDSELLTQPPIGPDRVRLGDGSWSDERPAAEDAGFGGVGPAPGQHQVPAGTVQRSDTWRGTAHPVDPGERAPYPGQEDVKKGTVQRSDTGIGQATPVVHDVPASQRDVKAGTVQRSSTLEGVATPIPAGDAVEAQKTREAADTKAGIGDPGKAAALPASHRKTKATKQATVKPAARVSPGAPNVRDDTSGLDPQGQPVAADVAAAAGVEPAKKPAEPITTPKKKTAVAKSSRAKSSGSKSSRPARSRARGTTTTTKKEK